ncbi:MAG TPA: hypothetical protein VMU27_03570 [Candidatus Paceibacterota bacterium]|nr:hypothetical protein [Candidatus Paceibacterota bacterium]
MKEFKRFAVWSNVFYLLPLVLAIYYQLWVVAFVLLLVIASSVAFHSSGEKNYIYSDWDAAALLIIANLVLWYLSGFELFYSMAIIGLALMALSIRFFIEHHNRGGIAHGFWHLTSAAVTLLCVLSYTTSVLH